MAFGWPRRFRRCSVCGRWHWHVQPADQRRGRNAGVSEEEVVDE